jgi:predicted O-methyltransferase YrrM
VDETDRLIARVKKEARGLMPAATYRRLYDSAARSGGGTFVEIGTYCGAATIALALGAEASRSPARILTADLLRPGIGIEGSSIEARIGALNRNFAAFGVGKSIHFVHGTSSDIVAEADPARIDLLLLDGGGRLETDLALLWSRLAADCPIVIDDISGRVHVRRFWRRAVIDQKHRISRLLADRFVEAGLLVRESEADGTGWFRKGKAETSADEIRLLALPAYHSLIKAEVGPEELGLGRYLLRAAARRIRPPR